MAVLTIPPRKERKSYTMINSVHKAPGGEPRQGKPDVHGWCFPGQKSKGRFYCSSILHKFPIRLQLIYRAQLRSMPCLAISAGTGLPACTCVDSPIKYSIVPVLGFVPKSQAMDMAGQVLAHWSKRASWSPRQMMGEGTASAMWSLSFLKYFVI